MPLAAVIFDDGLGELSPLTDLRAAFDIRTGIDTAMDRARARFDVIGAVTPPSLAAATRDRHPGLAVNDLGPVAQRSGPVLILNGRAPLASLLVDGLREGEAIVEAASGVLIAAVAEASRVETIIRGDLAGLTRLAPPLPPADSPSPGLILLTRPWHVRTLRDTCIRADLAWHVPRRLKAGAAVEPPAGSTCFGDHDLVIAPSAKIFPATVFDTTAGAILIDEEAVVRPGAIVCGPAYIGPHTHVLDRCLVKANSAIGPHCRVAGEIGGTIFQGYANKAHDGHLGDSYIGEWANLGAGTTNSNLLNTYGEVIARARPDGPNERTGDRFLGCIVGDHAKFAICTRIMTGAIVGSGTMWAAGAAVTGTVRAFSWVTDAGSRPYAWDKFAQVAATVMGRRGVTPSEAYLARLKDLCDGSAAQRA